MNSYKLPKTAILAYRAVALQQFGTNDAYGMMGNTKQEILIAQSVTRTEILSEFGSVLDKLVRLLHGIPDDFVCLYDVGTPENMLEILTASKLWKGKLSPCDAKSDVFFGRFYSFLLNDLNVNKEEILRKEMSYRGKKQTIKEEIQILRQIVQFCFECLLDACEHTIRVENGRKWFELALLGTRCEITNVMGFLKTVKKGTEGFEGSVRKILFKTWHKFPAYITLQNLMSLAYAYATGSLAFNACYQFEESVSWTDRDEIVTAISSLGSMISESVKKEEINPMFSSFLSVQPTYYYKYPEEKNTDGFLIGCRALAFLELMVPTKEISILVSDIIY